MRLLALDTSAAHCAAALLVGNAVVAETTEPMARGQAERLIPLAEDLLAGQNLHWRDLDALAVGVGPGNFTGIRIAVSAVRGLALALNIPVHGVTTFEALAHDINTPALVLLDARRDRVYAAGQGGLDIKPMLMPVADLDSLEPPPDTIIMGFDASAQARRLGRVPGSETQDPTARAIALAAAGRPIPDRPPAPFYLRQPDAAPSSEPPPVILDDA